MHWGTKADFAAAAESDEVRCSNHSTRMNYVVNPFEVEFRDYEEIGVWCSMPKALSSRIIDHRPPKIHIHKRFSGEEKKVIDRDFDAVVCSYNHDLGLFNNTEITKIQVIPTAVRCPQHQ